MEMRLVCLSVLASTLPISLSYSAVLMLLLLGKLSRSSPWWTRACLDCDDTVPLGEMCEWDNECSSKCCGFMSPGAGLCADRGNLHGGAECELGSSCECKKGLRCQCPSWGVCRPNFGFCCGSEVYGDPHMIGFHDQHIAWSGEDGGWYVLLSDEEGPVQMSVRLTAPIPEEFPERQLMTGFALMYGEGHSVVIETKHPYTTETDGCPADSHVPCLSEQALRIAVDGAEYPAVSADRAPLPGDATLTAFNLPTECQPYGGDVIWAAKAAVMEDHRRLAETRDLSEWVSSWSGSTAAPPHCEKFVADSGVAGLLASHSKHAVFRIETPSLSVRLHHGTNHQGGEILDDGRVLPELEFWQIDLHLESFELNFDKVTGILGETSRPILDEAGQPVTSGMEALRGEVGDYRVSGPLASDFFGVQQ